MKYLFYFTLFILFLSHLSNQNPPEIKYYEFALKKCNQRSDWSIHGLWPQYTPTKWPEYCHRFGFNVSALQEELPELNQVWYSCDERPSSDFWKHEYLKHGTCSPYNETEYFRVSLQLFHRIKADYLGYCDENQLQCLLPFNLNLTIRD